MILRSERVVFPRKTIALLLSLLNIYIIGKEKRFKMKIKVLQENLAKALTNLQKAIPSKPQLPILASIHIKVEDTVCQLSATDLYFGVRCKVQADVSESGEIVVPGKEFKEIISSLPPGPITLEYAESTLKIISAKSRAKLQCMSSEEYPEFPQSEGENLQLSPDQLDKVLQSVLFSASSDQARPVLTAVLFSLSEQSSRVVATDGFRLAVLDLSQLSSAQGEVDFLIPAKALGEVARISKQSLDANVVFSVSEELKQAFFSIDDVEVFVRLIEGDYPPYQKIIPSKFATTVIFDKTELLDNLKRASIFAREASNIVKFNIYPEQIQISASAPTIGEFKGELSSSKVEGGEAVIAFNTKYLLDFLQSTTEETIWFGMSESLKPALFKPEGRDDYQYIVMPFKVND